MQQWEELKRWAVPDRTLPLDRQFFQALCLITGLLALLVIVPLNQFQDLDPWVDRVVLVFGGVALVLAWAARRGHYLKKTLLVAIVACLDLIWFPNGGSQGSVGLYFFPAALFLVLFFEGPLRLALVGLMGANIAGLLLAELAWPHLATPFPQSATRALDLATGYFVSLLVCSLMLWVILAGFNQRKSRLAQALQALEESEARYRAQFDLASEGIFTVSTEGRVIEMNEAFARMHGYTRAELKEVRLQDLDTPESLAGMPGRMARLLAGEALTFEVEHYHKDGHTFPMEVSASLVTTGGVPVVLCFHRDITGRRREEAEARLREARSHQAQKMDSLGSLAGGVAHDMNNVLGAILGLASAHLATQPPDTPAHRAFDTISKAALRGGKMVKSLLNFSRVSPAEEVELDLNGILLEEVQLLERTTLSKVTLELDLAPDLNPVRGDAGALTHAFMNLCVNAVDAMPDKGTLALRTRNLDDDWIEVQVEDTGAGMPPEVLARIFDPFFTTKEAGKGTGLGLALVYSTVKAHQGRIEVHSQPGHGTCVRMRFPACGGAPQEAAGAEQAHPGPTPGALRVLLVDDDELIQSATEAILEVLGCVATIVPCGEDALAKVAEGLRPDAVILDMNMPGLGGAGTLPRLRELLPGVPVLLATGRADQTALDLLARHPGVLLLSKPFGMADLQRHLEAIPRG